MKQFHRLQALLALLLSLSACSQNTWVSQVDVATSNHLGARSTEVTTTLNTGRVTLMELQLPIYSGTKVIGSVHISPTVDSLSTLKIQIDVDKILTETRAPNVSTLPNGEAIPVFSTSIQKFRIGTAGSEFYSSISSDRNSAVFGVALIVPELATGTPAFAYSPFNFATVSGEAGVFTGAAANQSGFALFSNVNLTPNAGAKNNSRAAFAPANITSPDFARIRKLLLSLNEQKAKLQIK